MADETISISPGLANPHFDFVYNIGTKDLLDGLAQISNGHLSSIQKLFSSEPNAAGRPGPVLACHVVCPAVAMHRLSNS